MIRRASLFVAALTMGSFALLAGCENKRKTPAPGAPGAPSAAAPKHEDHDHSPGDRHDGHADDGPATELGTEAIGAFQVKASRDGVLSAGGEAPVDLWVTPSGGSRVAAVRAWIGTQDAKGTMKAKMELEKDNHHNHVDVPKPLPEGSRLWVEIEDDKGAKALGSFDLKK